MEMECYWLCNRGCRVRPDSNLPLEDSERPGLHLRTRHNAACHLSRHANSQKCILTQAPEAETSCRKRENAVLSRVNVVRRRTPPAQVLKNSEARYRRLFETAQDGILILDAKTGLITDVNPYLMQRLNYSREDFLGKALWEIGLFRDIEASKSAFLELMRQGLYPL